MKNTTSITIKAVGDIAPGDFSIKGLGVYSVTKKYGCAYIFEKIKHNLKDCDILIGNLECVLSRHPSVDLNRHPGLPEFADALHDIGFDAVSLANNHTLDHGVEALNETISYCTMAGIKVCGLRGNGPYFSQPVILTRDATTIGILAYNWIGLEDNPAMGNLIATVGDGIVNYTWNRNKTKNLEARARINQRNKHVVSDIAMLRKEVDIVVLMPHWGYEWTHYPPYGVVLEARNFIDSGVDIIIGSHPHVPQGVERYQNGLIVYSLGNFLFDSITDKFRYGMVVKTECTPFEIAHHELSFVMRGKHHRPEPVTGKIYSEQIDLIEESSNAIVAENAAYALDDEIIYNEFEEQYRKLKYHKIVFLFVRVFRYPFLIKHLLTKIYNFFSLCIMRLYGKKVRW